MSEFKETVTTSNDQGVDNSGNQVHQQTRKVATSSSADGRSTITNIVWYIVGLIEVLIAIRFILKVFGANPNSSFVDFIYNITGVLTAPFDSIFRVTSSTSGIVHSVFEPSILVAAAVYGLIGWGIVSLINVDRNE